MVGQDRATGEIPAGELARLRAELRAAEARAAGLAAFLATTSHELREPMNGVLGMARLLGETVLDEEQPPARARTAPGHGLGRGG